MQTIYFKNIALGGLLIIVIITTVKYNIQEDIFISNIDFVEFIDDEGISCEENGNLSVVDKNIYFLPNSIFFIETTCKQLTSRQACSVESAAKANPDRQVNLLINIPISSNAVTNKSISKLMDISNVKVIRIKPKDYIEGTPLYAQLREKHATPANTDLSFKDIIKYLTIYKYSGIYLSLDVVVTRSFQDLKENWVVKESPHSITSDIFSFSNNENGRILSNIAMTILINDINRNSEEKLTMGSNTETHTIMRRIMSLWCGKTNLIYVTTETCEDIQVLEPEKFFPISFSDKQKYYRNEDFDALKMRNAYTFQIWDYFTRTKKIPNEALYRKIAKEYCPIIYNFYGDQFGL